jgi:large subunit ribosomal protein L17e
VAKASGEHIRVHYKHCREIAQAIKGRLVGKAKAYLENVLQYKEAVPITKYTGGRGRHAQAKPFGVPGDTCAWPQKATKVFLDLLTNVEANATAKNLDLSKVTIVHAQANQAPHMRRRTYRAHGRVNAYMSSPAHIEIIGEEANEEIVKEAEPVAARLTKKQQAQAKGKAGGKKIPVGGGN